MILIICRLLTATIILFTGHYAISTVPCSFVALVGHTGSGKSTPPAYYRGITPTRWAKFGWMGERSPLNHRVLRRGVVMVQQDPVVMADTFWLM